MPEMWYPPEHCICAAVNLLPLRLTNGVRLSVLSSTIFDIALSTVPLRPSTFDLALICASVAASLLNKYKAPNAALSRRRRAASGGLIERVPRVAYP